MKTKSTVLTLVATVVSVLAFAANPKMAVVGQQKNGTYKVYYEGASTGKVTLKVYDNSSREIFTETIKGLNKFMRPLNFAGMDPGVYTIEISDENGTQAQNVIHIKNAKEETTIKAFHVCKLQDGKYLVSVANEGTQDINISVYDNNENLIHTENRTVNGDLGLVYNLRQVSGQPVFVVTDMAGNNLTGK
ncbi:MAG TPA: hypothetical protein VL728_08075 [Cyclobacteriaceae bacterium]|jgi:hypothetical protein|nr:hypothetical protein [Cyclobacteriaceae bacterium]